MVSFQSFKEAPKQESFSWADLNFSTLYKIIEARANNYKQFTSYVSALEGALNFFIEKDQQYQSDIAVLKMKKINFKAKAEEKEAWFWDEKFKILSSLVGRVNQGKVKISEYTQNSLVLKEIAGKLAQGIGQNLFITGKPGSGKSEGAEKIAQKISEINGLTHNIVKNTTFTPLQFANRYNDVEEVPQGSVIIFDEAGVTFNSRDHFDAGNKVFSKLLQIIRHRGLLVIFTAPDLSFIDTHGRKLLHWWFETDKINKSQGICYMKPKIVELQQMTGKIFYPYPIYEGQQITSLKVEALDFKSRSVYQNLGKMYKEDLAIKTQIQLAMKKPDDTEALTYIILRKKGLKQLLIRKEHIPMSQDKATRMENEYKRIKALGNVF